MSKILQPCIENKKILLLDLDNTLISKVNKEKYDFIISHQNKTLNYIRKRPYLDEFFDFIFLHFNVGIWSAGNIEYINIIIDNIFTKYKDKIKFIYTNENCIAFNNVIFYKPLNIIFKDISNIIILDDNYHTFKYNVYNAINISSWYGDMTDKKLLECIKILFELKDNDIITINKIKKYYKGFSENEHINNFHIDV